MYYSISLIGFSRWFLRISTICLSFLTSYVVFIFFSHRKDTSLLFDRLIFFLVLTLGEKLSIFYLLSYDKSELFLLQYRSPVIRYSYSVRVFLLTV